MTMRSAAGLKDVPPMALPGSAAIDSDAPTRFATPHMNPAPGVAPTHPAWCNGRVGCIASGLRAIGSAAQPGQPPFMAYAVALPMNSGGETSVHARPEGLRRHGGPSEPSGARAICFVLLILRTTRCG